MKRTAFSLVELSIVLVILGLLVGGILAGQSLIRASELRAVTSEATRFQTAFQAFRDKYFAIPGDMTNATLIWGKDTAACNAAAGSAGTPGTCNGNGDGILLMGAEIFRFWQHLSLAGMVEGTYSGGSTTVIGTSVPASKLGNAGWSAVDYSSYNSGDTEKFAATYGNTLLFGTLYPGGFTDQPALSPEEMWNIDTKMDDGMPATGRMLSGKRIPCTNSTSATDYGTTYKLGVKQLYCPIHFPRYFN
jgi:prepilin-type N-terminal cleavage/methylation domain-containing protein